MKKIFLALFFALLITTTLFYSKNHFKKSAAPSSSPNSSIHTSTQELDQHLISIVENQDPRAALIELSNDIQANDKIAATCHPIAHDIGHEAFKKYQDFGKAMTFQNEICNSGYLHGVIEAYFSTTKNLSLAIENTCKEYPTGSLISWECYHGIGHGVMFYSSNNLPFSLTSCSSFQDNFAKSACINGIFMENFNTDQNMHLSKFLKADDPFYPCNQEAAQYKSDCYLYAPAYYLNLHRGAYQEALEWCLSAPSQDQSSCSHGVGSEVIKENISNPKLAEKVCMKGSPDQVSSCIMGVVGLYIKFFGSLDQAKALCPKLEPSNQITCQEKIQSSLQMFSL